MKKTSQPFSPDSQTKIILIKGGRNAVQSTLDFDYASGKKEPSIAAIVNPGVRQWMNYHWGKDEILITTVPTIRDAFSRNPDISAAVNFASERSAAAVAQELLQYPSCRAQVIIAEGMPERDVREIRARARKQGTLIIGPATVGAVWAGRLRMGNPGGAIELQVEAGLHREGSVGIVTKSGGLMNELSHMVHRVADGVHTAIAVGGDRFPCTRLVDVVRMYERIPSISVIVMLGEIGGDQEYEVAEAIANGEITKPVVAWASGICARILPQEFQFGHAGAQARTEEESADAKNEALRRAGALVPDRFEDFESVVRDTAHKAGIQKQQGEEEGVDVSLFQGRRLSHIISTISDDRGESPRYMTEKIVDLAKDPSVTIGDIISLLWFRRRLPQVALDFFNIILKLTAEHGPNVSGAHNTIIASRAGKDLVSSLASGLLTIGPRFGGAIGAAAKNWQQCVAEGKAPRAFVDDMKRAGKLIPGIGHRYKNKLKPDDRVAFLDAFARERLDDVPHLAFARGVENVTLQKRHNLILNIDGAIAAVALDIFRACGFSEEEVGQMIEQEILDGLFVLGRSIGLIGHHIDQKRIGAPLYRHPVEDTLYWNERDL